jgi:hypothetical protein
MCPACISTLAVWVIGSVFSAGGLTGFLLHRRATRRRPETLNRRAAQNGATSEAAPRLRAPENPCCGG